MVDFSKVDLPSNGEWEGLRSRGYLYSLFNILDGEPAGDSILEFPEWVECYGGEIGRLWNIPKLWDGGEIRWIINDCHISWSFPRKTDDWIFLRWMDGGKTTDYHGNTCNSNYMKLSSILGSFNFRFGESGRLADICNLWDWVVKKDGSCTYMRHWFSAGNVHSYLRRAKLPNSRTANMGVWTFKREHITSKPCLNHGDVSSKQGTYFPTNMAITHQK